MQHTIPRHTYVTSNKKTYSMTHVAQHLVNKNILLSTIS